MIPALSLQGRTALVTGAATGIGRACAVRLAQAGATVWINHLGQADAAAALVRDIVAAGGRAQTIEADVSDALAVQRMAEAVGAVDVLVNNAGVIQEKPFLDTTEADWDRLLAVDLKAVFLVCRAFVPGMLSLGQGAIVNIASDLALLGRERYAPYCAAKAGVIALTKSLAREFASQHIRANAVAPGPVATAMVSLEHMSAEWVEKELAIPQHRLGAPEEIADSVLFLASDLSRFYTGQVLGPNGGSVMP
ncbi:MULTISPECIES: SDR family NAD(P)-dependent oxidoreductase [Hydrogenophaga]|uniref:Beta-ketoacyl-ACP reductase n=1 Tax=Hydrogenophaga electricum TaxID=1230953 RepID=A0ABQ6C5K5_9BURK|nr:MULTISPECIES: 3-oxoacyl-ACP reductase family protein [Hydrogenophaga]GLS15583.1 beta-ketoacyl-ACP reductase [Hydrogenophaga electricum]